MAHILLYGPPGSGKTTLGKALADSLRLPFVDLDQAVEARTGRSIAQLIQQRGEPDFRDLESRVLAEQLACPGAVIALGGGTLLRDENRALAEAGGKIVCLKADAALLGQRLRSDARVRPLLAGDLEAKLAGLLARRRSHYASFAAQLDAAQPPADLLLPLQAAAGHFHLSALGDYEVIIEPEALDRLGERLCARGATRLLLVTDENVGRLYSARACEALRRVGLAAATLVIAGGEACKTVETVSRLWRGFLQAGLDRKSTVVALGGGVVSDVTGFAASTYMRGIQWVCVPTTLLSMVDASIGGKTGIDLPEGKNLAGAFHAPQLVLSDPSVLASLPEAELRAGLAEMVKHGILADAALFQACAAGLAAVKARLDELIRRAVAVKVRIVERDPYERGERAALNFGHTVGHALELASAFRISHGEAVAMGMVAEARLGERLAITRPGLSTEIAAALGGLGLPTGLPRDLPSAALVRAMRADKKMRAGAVRFALPVDVGRVQIGVAVSDLEAALEEDRP